MPTAGPRIHVHSPTRVFALVLLVVFSVEGAIMLCLPRLPAWWQRSIPSSLLDACALTLIVAPAVWYLVALPLRRLLRARGDLLRRVFESQEQERARVARDLHDGVGQQLTALMVGLRTVEEARDLWTVRTRVHDLREFAAIAHGEVRRLARGLRPIILEELGLVAAIERLCEDFERSHDVKVVLDRDAAPSARLAPEMETALYRIAQEALANVGRHASASQVDVAFAQSGSSVELSIRDDGCGFDVDEPGRRRQSDSGLGLGSIRERALLLGGTLTLRSSPGGGTMIRVRIPVDT